MKKTKKILQILLGFVLMITQIVISYLDRFIIAFLFWMSIEPLKLSVMTLKELKLTLIRIILVGGLFFMYSIW